MLRLPMSHLLLIFFLLLEFLTAQSFNIGMYYRESLSIWLHYVSDSLTYNYIHLIDFTQVVGVYSKWLFY